MLSTVGQRLGALLRSKNYSIASFARKSQMRWHHLRDLMVGRSEMDLGELHSISSALGLSNDEICWLANPRIPGATPPVWLKVDDLEDGAVGDAVNGNH